MRIRNHSCTQTQATEISSPHNEQDSQSVVSDSFEKESKGQKLARYTAAHHIKKLNEKQQSSLVKLPRSGPFVRTDEERFMRNPSARGYFRLVQAFDAIMIDCNQPKFLDMERFLISPGQGKAAILSWTQEDKQDKREHKLEEWHEKHVKEFNKISDKTQHQVEKRNEKTTAKGKGIGGRMTKAVGKTKAASFYTKNHLTLRGQMFRLNNELFGKSIYEILPRYTSRKAQHIGVRISQFGVNAAIVAAGYALVPVSFGISSIVSTHLQTVVTLSGEAFALKLDGAKGEKIASHAALRGMQLTIPKAIPIAGKVIYYGENIMFGGAAAGIVSTTLADWILQSMSSRYTSTLNIDDLGDPSVLVEMNQRIDYLSRFLLPHGQKLLIQEKNPERRDELRKVLKSHFKLLTSLEHKKTKALNFYRLALMAEKVPASHRAQIQAACDQALPDTRINSHKVVRRCLATLLASA